MNDEPRPLRMNAYYYSFTPTGVELVDRVLSCRDAAGKALGIAMIDEFTRVQREAERR